MSAWQVPEGYRSESLSKAFRNLSADVQQDLMQRYQCLTQNDGMEPSRNNTHENGSIAGAQVISRRRRTVHYRCGRRATSPISSLWRRR